MKADVKVVQLFVDEMVGIPKFSYPARSGGDRPTGEFAHIAMLEEYQESIPANYVLSQTTEQTTNRIVSLARLRMRIGVVETDGVAASKIMHGWTSEAIKALMISTGYGFIRCTPISLEDAKLEREWEPRQGFAVEFYVTRTYDEVVDNITGMYVSGEYITPGLDSILLEIDINET